MSSVDPPSPPSPSTMSQEDLFRAIQSIDLNMRNMNLTLNQRIDQACALFESRASESLPTTGVLGSAPSGSRRLLEPLVPVPVTVPSDVVASHGPAVRVEAPKFSGHDPGGWIYKVQSYFDYFRTPNDIRLRLVGLLFDSPASNWFLYQQNNNLITSWQGLLEAVRQRFDLAYYKDYFVPSQSKKQSHGHQENSGDIAVEKTDSVQSVVAVEERLVEKEQHHQLSSSVVIQSRIDEGHDWKQVYATKTSDHNSRKSNISVQSKGISKPATSLFQATQLELQGSAVGDTNGSVENLFGTSPDETLYDQSVTEIVKFYVVPRPPACFIKEEGKTCLCDSSEGIENVEPLWPKVSARRNEVVETENQFVEQLDYQSLSLQENAKSSPESSSGIVTPDNFSPVLSIGQDFAVQNSQCSLQPHDTVGSQTSSICAANVSPGLILYLAWPKLNSPLSLYRAFLQQQIGSGHGMFVGIRLFSETYTITYGHDAEGNIPSMLLYLRQESNLLNLIAHDAFCRDQVHEIGEQAADIFKGKTSKPLSWWCFNPGITMRGLSKRVIGSIILTSGTLSSMNSFAAEFHIQLANSHVISLNQIGAGVFRVGPSGRSFNSSYQYGVLGIGIAIVNFALIVSDGLLVFFPSYYLLDQCTGCWKNMSSDISTIFWERSCKHQQPLSKPQQSSDVVNAKGHPLHNDAGVALVDAKLLSSENRDRQFSIDRSGDGETKGSRDLLQFVQVLQSIVNFPPLYEQCLGTNAEAKDFRDWCQYECIWVWLHGSRFLIFEPTIVLEDKDTLNGGAMIQMNLRQFISTIIF